MKITNYIRLTALAFPVLMIGCQDDDISVTTDTTGDNRRIEIAAPAGDITYKVSDLLNDIDNEYVFVDETGLVNVEYTQEVEIDWESLVTLRDFSRTWYYSPSAYAASPQLKAAAQVSFSEKIKLNHRDDVRYDELTMDGGSLTASIVFPYGTTGQVDISIPEVVENGQPLSYSFSITENNRIFYINENLNGMDVVPSQGVDSSYISVITTMDLTEVVLGDVELDFSLVNMQPGLAFGYFGQQQSARPREELIFDVFDELDLADEIEFFDFKIDLQVSSEIGVPFDVITENMQFFDKNDELTHTLRVNGSEQIRLELESAVYGDPIEKSETLFHISKENSENIVAIGNSYPRRMIFDVTSFSNPDGEIQQNFMGPSNNLNGMMKVVMPAWFNTTKEYARKDTIDFDFNDILDENDEDARELESFTVFFDFFSKIPLDISASAWVIDAGGNKIDDLLESEINVIEGGNIDETGYVSEATHTEFTITIDGEQINEFLDRNAMNIILETKFNTGDSEYVKIYDDMDFNAVVSFEASGKIPSF